MIDTIFIFIYLCLNRECDFFTKVSHHWLFPTTTGHGTENVLLMKFEILGLGVVIVATTFLCFDDQWLLFSHTLCPSRKHVRSQSILLLCCIDSLTSENFQMALQTLDHWLSFMPMDCSHVMHRSFILVSGDQNLHVVTIFNDYYLLSSFLKNWPPKKDLQGPFWPSSKCFWLEHC